MNMIANTPHYAIAIIIAGCILLGIVIWRVIQNERKRNREDKQHKIEKA